MQRRRLSGAAARHSFATGTAALRGGQMASGIQSSARGPTGNRGPDDTSRPIAGAIESALSKAVVVHV